MKTLLLFSKNSSGQDISQKPIRTFYTKLRSYGLTLIFSCFIIIPVSAQDWLQIGNDIGGAQAYESFGNHIGMSSDGYTVAAGAVYHDTEFEDAGAARVYAWNGSAWIQKGDTFTGMAEDDEFGYSVALNDDGNIFAVGAKEDDDDQLKPGYTQVFSWNGSAWEQMGANLTGDNAYDRFGCNMSISSNGHILAVASRNSPVGDESGSINVYEWDGSSWNMKGSKINGENPGEYFGSSSISLSSDGSIMAAGSVWGGPSSKGYVKIFEWDGSDWTLRGSQIFGDNEGDMFGMSVSLSDDGNTLAVGARNHDGGGVDRGQVKVFSWSGSDWTQKGNDIVGPDDQGFLGWSVCMSADGNSYVAGIPAYINHDYNNGRVRVYEWDGVSWEQKGAQIEGLGDNDRCGWTVAMNSDGSKILLGVPFHSNEGQLRIFMYGFVDITEQDFGSSFRVYPNPVADHVNIEFGGMQQNVLIEIRNIAGQSISSHSYGNVEKIRLDLELPEGAYIIEINNTEGNSAVMKFVKGR